MSPRPVRAAARVRPSLRRTALSIALRRLAPWVAAAVLAPAPVHAQAQTQALAPRTVAFNIPAGPLGAALGTFGVQAGVMVASDPGLTAGAMTRGLTGTYGVQAALERLLAGTGLQAVARAEGGYRLRQAPAETTATLAPVMVTGTYNTTTDGTGSYTSPAVTIGKTAQALKDIPQSITVLTRQRMDDQDMTSLPDAVNNTAGMVGVQGVGAGVAINSRGFPVDLLQYDGVSLLRNSYSLGNWEQDSLVFYDRVEILRGAAGLLQGAGSPGGAINLVRKRGGAEPSVVVTGKVGSWDHYGLTLDAGGPLNESGTLRGRVVLDEDRSHSYIDYVWDKTRNLYAALDFDVTEATTVGLGVSNRYSRSRPMFVGYPRFEDGGSIDLPRSTFTGSTWNRATNDQTIFNADVTHRLNSSWRFRLAGVAMDEDNTTVHQRVAGAVQRDGSGLNYGNFGVDFKSRQRGMDMSVAGDFDAWGMAQEVVVGANYSKLTTNDRFTRAWESGGNIFDLDHHRPWQDMDSIAQASGYDSRSAYDIRQKGIYGTWRVKPIQSLALIGGGRVGWFDYSYSGDGDTTTSTTSGRFIPYAGIVYSLTDNWSVYGSYTTVFEPQTQRTVSGSLLKPIEGNNYEVGVKGELADGRVNALLALFRYDHKNRAVNDYDAGFACNGWYCSRAAGKVRSQGVEAEISGEVVKGLELYAGYAYNTTKFLEDPDNQGKVFSTWTPKHMLRLWANYRLPGALNRLSVGAGVNTQTATISSDRAFKLAGFTIWNARLGYQATPELSFGLNVNNVFDKKYYVPSYNTLSGNNYYGEPRNVMLTVRYAPKL
ncbi:MAG: TonB-dependent siderophore receptor [Achromobacter mucicolens]|jgi:iron complex outermembrane receptor protein/outer membrane receptor for ferric coprogen and ferric-rhodotorulic acid|uniref:TonB-dependent siderophore receptor n=1 Tax=Achromobacter mucicolens TaxID=1389922 RepID=UPI00242D88BB|nr:TonB-dependent siderophore receptor [Achromobacter mucicolens]MDF2863270.1 TonB-dependent siderophore receptor [Achromobacter mucicolens]